jgi:hypothetical protein
MAVTTAAVASVVIAGTSAGMSFGQARQQKKIQKEAQQDAKNAMAEARKALEVNYYDQLAVQKEPYELEREALLAQGALATQAGVEGDRGAAATAGRVQAAMNDAQAGVRTAMGKEMTDLEKLSAEEDSRLRDIGVQLDLEEVAGAQQAAADAAVARSQAIASGMEQAGAAVQGAINLVPLYQQNMSAQKSAVQQSIGDKSIGDLGMQQYKGQPIGLMDFQSMSNPEWRQFKNFLSPEQSRQLFQSDAYIKNYNPNPFEIK